jgi:hypothetical protein
MWYFFSPRELFPSTSVSQNGYPKLPWVRAQKAGFTSDFQAEAPRYSIEKPG